MARAALLQVSGWIFGALGVGACQAGRPPAEATAPSPLEVTVGNLGKGSPTGTRPEPVAAKVVGFVAEGTTGHRASPETCTRGGEDDGACATDADCDGAEQVCHCKDGGAGACVAARCKVDGDCASGECALVARNGCWAEPLFACRSAKDVCRSDSDCGGGQRCLVSGFADDESGPFTCQTLHRCVRGRPLYVDDRARVAARGDAAGWAAEGWRFALDGLSPADREALAEEAIRSAFDEHASVAAFARTLTELMALGAPAALLQETHDALGDEIRHARLCFALAAAAGTTAGPGRFPEAVAPFAGGDDHARIRALAASVFRGGCLGETAAAVEAATKGQESSGDLRAFYMQIAEDEARHAALAWKTLRWLADQAPAVVEAVVREELAAGAGRGDRAVHEHLVAPLAAPFLAA